MSANISDRGGEPPQATREDSDDFIEKQVRKIGELAALRQVGTPIVKQSYPLDDIFSPSPEPPDALPKVILPAWTPKNQERIEELLFSDQVELVHPELELLYPPPQENLSKHRKLYPGEIVDILDVEYTEKNHDLIQQAYKQVEQQPLLRPRHTFTSVHFPQNITRAHPNVIRDSLPQPLSWALLNKPARKAHTSTQFLNHPRLVLVSDPEVPEMAPITPRSGGLNRLGKPSVKHLECYWWKHRGGCRFSEEECLYAHHDTGRSADAPRAVVPGEPARAGRALEVALERQEGPHRPLSTIPEALEPRPVRPINFAAYDAVNPSSIPTFPQGIGHTYPLTAGHTRTPYPRLENDQGVVTAHPGGFGHIDTPTVTHPRLVHNQDIIVANAQAHLPVSSPHTGTTDHNVTASGSVTGYGSRTSSHQTPNYDAHHGIKSFSAPSNSGAVRADISPVSPTPAPNSAKTYRSFRSESSESSDPFPDYGRAPTPFAPPSSRNVTPTRYATAREHRDVAAPPAIAPLNELHLRSLVQTKERDNAVLQHELQVARATNARLGEELDKTNAENADLRHRNNQLHNALNQAHQNRGPSSRLGYNYNDNNYDPQMARDARPDASFYNSLDPYQRFEFSRQTELLGSGMEHFRHGWNQASNENTQLREVLQGLGRRV